MYDHGNSHFKTNIVRHDEKTNRAIAIDHVTLNMYKHPIKSCLTRTPPEFNEWTTKLSKQKSILNALSNIQM